jgi:HlyD family secretion protein
VILGVLVGLIVGASIPARSWWHEKSLPKYTTATVSRGRVETVVNSTGTVKPVLTVTVGAFTSGPISEVLADFNSKVKKGDLLAQIDPKLFEAAVARDKAAIETQEADRDRVEALLEQARNNERRARKLREINKDYISETDLDQFFFTRKSLEAQLKLAEANVLQARANLKNSEANLGYTHITSPVDGIIIERKVDRGQTVAAAYQTPELFTIAPKMDEFMHIYASVDEADIGQIHLAKQLGQGVKFTVDAYPDQVFDGTIDQIRMNSTTTQNVVTYPVIVKAPNVKAPNGDLKLMPGMTANLSFQVEAKDNVLRVPASALRFVPLKDQVRPEDQHHLEPLTESTPEGTRRSAAEKAEQARKRRHRIVWVKDGEKLRAVPVTLGLIENHYAELIEGDLHDGEQVVTGVESAAR